MSKKFIISLRTPILCLMAPLVLLIFPKFGNHLSNFIIFIFYLFISFSYLNFFSNFYFSTFPLCIAPCLSTFIEFPVFLVFFLFLTYLWCFSALAVVVLFFYVPPCFSFFTEERTSLEF